MILKLRTEYAKVTFQLDNIFCTRAKLFWPRSCLANVVRDERSKARRWRANDWRRARCSTPRNIGMSKKLEGRSAPINRNIRFAAISTKPATTKLQYNTRSFYSAPSANNEPRRTITRRDFAQIERVINSRGQSRCVPVALCGFVLDESPSLRERIL